MKLLINGTLVTLSKITGRTLNEINDAIMMMVFEEDEYTIKISDTLHMDNLERIALPLAKTAPFISKGMINGYNPQTRIYYLFEYKKDIGWTLQTGHMITPPNSQSEFMWETFLKDGVTDMEPNPEWNKKYQIYNKLRYITDI